ncbi:MAG: response regulator, partial [Pseudomonadota bacterium]
MPRVLIVDDKEENLRFLQTLLSKHGYTVDRARHGAEALAIARQALPDLIISDLLMPVMDGYTLLRHWKTDVTFSRIPFIIYTATFTDEDDQRFGKNLGADAYILKPARTNDFLTRVQKVLATAAVSSPLEPLPTVPVDDDETTLKYYSERLIHKLEETSRQLELANQALQQEIGEHRQADEAIRFHNTILQTQQRNSLDAILVINAEGQVLSYNDQLLGLWDISRELLEDCRSTPLLKSAVVLQQIGSRLEEPAVYVKTIEYLQTHQREKSLEEVRFRDGRI